MISPKQMYNLRKILERFRDAKFSLGEGAPALSLSLLLSNSIYNHSQNLLTKEKIPDIAIDNMWIAEPFAENTGVVVDGWASASCGHIAIGKMPWRRVFDRTWITILIQENPCTVILLDEVGIKPVTIAKAPLFVASMLTTGLSG